MLERRVRITNQLGLHARAAAKLVRLVAQFKAVVTLSQGGTRANAASILDVLALGAGYGKYIDIVVEGPDEADVVIELEELFKTGFGEL